MSSLRQLLASHRPVLLLDAASAVVQVGVLRGDAPAQWQTSRDEAGIGVFQCVGAAGLPIEDAAAFVFCDGPGSILGIRTVAMALRTWNLLKSRPTFAYCSLAVVAHALSRPDITVIADARRDTWHHYRIGGNLQRVGVGNLSGELVMPEDFRHWSALPPHVQTVPYSLAELLPRIADVDLFYPATNPDAFLHEEPSYATWTPQIHRAPASS